MDASDIIRRNLQITQYIATVNKIQQATQTVDIPKFKSYEEKQNFTDGMAAAKAKQ